MKRKMSTCIATFALILVQTSPAAVHLNAQSGASDIVSEESTTESVSLGGGVKHDAVSDRHENDNGGAASHSCRTFESSRKVNAGGKCRLSQEEISAMLDDQRRVWMVDEAVVRRLDNDVQLLIDCTQEGDSVFFPAGSHIRPSRRVEIPWRLTVGTFAGSTSATDETAFGRRERTVFSCRRNRGLFYVRSKSVTFRDVIFSDCSLDVHGVGAIVDIGGCGAGSEMHHIVFQRVAFRDNRLNGTSALSAANAACMSVEMMDVRFLDNECSGICFAHLSGSNTLTDVKMKDNTKIMGANPISVLILLAPGSVTAASGLVARRNNMTAVSANGAALNLTHSRFHGNANSSVITLYEAIGVRISNCAFFRNQAGVSDGAAIRVVQSERIQILRCKFESNVAVSGGAIAAHETTLRLEDSIFSNNRARRNGGAGSVIGGSLELLMFSQILNNSAGQSGGGFRIDHARLQISSCTLAGNNAVIRGGAVDLESNALLHAESTRFSDNTALSDGGAVAALSAQVSLRQCALTKNAAFDGGAVDASYTSTVRIEQSTITGNNATGEFGGGMHVSDDCDVELLDSGFVGNVAGKSGGAVSLSQSTLIARNITVHNNTCTQVGGGLRVQKFSSGNFTESTFFGNNASFGGCLTVRDSVISVAASRFENCLAKNNGGALNIEQGSTLRLTRTRIAGNRANSRGGGIQCRNATFIAIEMQLLRNEAKSGGGGIVITQSSSMKATKSKIRDNRSLKVGGGVMMMPHTRITIDRTVFSNNNASWKGGALYADDDGNLTIRRSQFFENSALGGGSVAVGHSSVVIRSTTFRQDSARRSGGSVNAHGMSDLSFTDVSITASKATSGGGLYLFHSSLVAHGMLVSANRAVKNGGGLRASHSSKVLCSACTFRNNVAGLNGGAVSLKATLPQMLAYQFENSRFVRNRAELGGALFFSTGQLEEDCARPGVNCTFAALISTRLLQNSASVGAALFISDPKTLRYQCTEPMQKKDPGFRSMDDFTKMELVNSRSECSQWDRNHAKKFGPLVASFARDVRPSVKRDITGAMEKWNGTVLRIDDHRSGEILPAVVLQVVDGFGQGPALGTSNASVEAIVSSEDRFFVGNTSVFLDNGEAEISGIVGFQRPGVYRVNIDFSEDVLPRLTIVVSVRDCAFGESRQANGTFCSPCSESQFNFDADLACQACPDNGDCSAGTAIQPKAGYWHGDPCAQQIQQCPVEEACAFTDRAANLSALTEELHSCEHNKTFLERYQAAQCREGYRDALCGACADTHGRTRSLKCAQCHSQHVNVLMYTLSLALLLFLSSFAIKSNLTSQRLTILLSSRRWGRSFRLQPIRSATHSETNGTERSEGEIHVETEDELPRRTEADIERARQRAEKLKLQITEIFKITINFLQVIAVAVAVNVNWTRHMISLFSAADLVGNGAAGGLSLPIDCFLPSETTIPRSVLRTFIFMAIPVLIVVFFVIFWIATTCKIAQTWMYCAKRILLSYLVVIYLAYVTITKTAANALLCIRVYASDDETTLHWAMDTSIRCYQASHAVLVGAFALPALFIVSFGFPVTLAIVLTRARHPQASMPSWLTEATGFLYRAYDERLAFWESIVMLRKSLLAATVASGSVLDGNVQGVMAICVLTIALYIHTLFQPFKNEFGPLNLYEGASLVVSQLTFVSGILFNSGSVGETVRILLTVSLGLMIFTLSFFLFFKLVEAIVCYSYAFLEVEGVDIPETWGPCRVFCKFLALKCHEQFSSLTKRLSVMTRCSRGTAETT